MLFEKIHLEDTEKVLRIVRKHWFIITAELVGIAFVAILPVILMIFFMSIPFVGESLGDIGAGAQLFTVFFILAWLQVSVTVGFMIWTNYYLDLWIITDRRIIYVDQKSFFHRNVSMFRLERLQDIEIRTVGLLQTFLNYGTLTAQTAGHNEQNFMSTGLPDPRGLQAMIQRAMDARLRRLHTADTAAIH